MRKIVAPSAKIIPAALCLNLSFSPAALCGQTSASVFSPIGHAVSPRLRDINLAIPSPQPLRTTPRMWAKPPTFAPAQGDPVLQDFPGPPASAARSSTFEGVCNAIRTCGSSSQQYASGLIALPPDTNGAAGDTQYVQWVNYALAVFDKATGRLAHRPIPGNALWGSLGGPCASSNSGDPIALFDKAAHRWVLMQPVFTKPYAVCIAVSQTPDATAEYNLYAFAPTVYFPDYPKMGIWPDGYYMSIDLYTGQGYGGKFKGALLCAFDRARMLAGDPDAKAICPPQLSADFAHLLPSDLDGARSPPAGAPNYFLNLGSDSRSLNLWRFHSDFTTGQWTLTGPANIQVAPFAFACGGGVCIPQLGTNRLLDSLGDRPMHRLAYRNFGDHQSLVATHSVSASTNAGTSVGVRWYEIRNPGGTPAVFQQGTFAPDANVKTNYRWMGSIAMDKQGDMAVGYSESNGGMNPGIYFAGRAPTDAPGVLQAETPIAAGAGSQTNAPNWGDYSSLSIDPVDDCTFWYTTEYYKANSNYNWSTKIASFKFGSCD